MKFDYDRFTIEVTEHSGEIKVIIKDTATKYRRKLRQVGTVRTMENSKNLWCWSIRQIGVGKAKLWNVAQGQGYSSKKLATEAVEQYIRTNIERGHADDNRKGDSVQP